MAILVCKVSNPSREFTSGQHLPLIGRTVRVPIGFKPLSGIYLWPAAICSLFLFMSVAPFQTPLGNLPLASGAYRRFSRAWLARFQTPLGNLPLASSSRRAYGSRGPKRFKPLSGIYLWPARVESECFTSQLFSFKPLSGIYLWPALNKVVPPRSPPLTVSNPSREFTSGQPNERRQHRLSSSPRVSNPSREFTSGQLWR